MNFSVLMSVYAKEKPEYLAAALESIFQQSYQSNEVIIIKDGGLTAELDQVVAEYTRRYSVIKVYQFENNVQLGRALAKGVQLCTNELIARMDSDDLVMKDRFAGQYQFMQAHPEIAVVGGWIEEFSEESSHLTVKTMPETMAEIKKYAKLRNPLNHMTVMFRRSAVLECGNYEHFPLLEDYLLWSKMLSAGKLFYNLPQVLVKARTGQGMYARRGGLRYFKQYLRLRRMQYQSGMTSLGEYCYSIICTFGVTMIPNRWREAAYKSVLRRK